MFNALEDAASYFSDAQIIIMGHNHQMGVVPLPSIVCSSIGGRYKTKEVHRIVGRSGSYLKAYEEGRPSYAVDSMMRPSTLGSLPVKITPTRWCGWENKKRYDNRWVEIESIVRA